jgi:hypothetical protein
MSDSDSEEAERQADAERDGLEAGFPPEKFSGIVEAMGLPAEPEGLRALRCSLLDTLYFLHMTGSGQHPTREELESGITELRNAAWALDKSLRYSRAWRTVGSLGSAEPDPLYDREFRTTLRKLAENAERKLIELRSRRDRAGRPPKVDFWEILPDLARVYQQGTGDEAKKQRYARGSRFYSFVVAVNNFLKANMPELAKQLPKNPSAIRAGLRTRGY